MKAQATTAVHVYQHDIAPTLKRRQQLVRQELAAFYQNTGSWPTALELLCFVTGRHLERYDVNSIRPRLHELWTANQVEHGNKRRCAVSGKTALTWMLPRRLF